MQNLIATTFEVVHYIALQAVHYKPLQEVHLSRYNHLNEVSPFVFENITSTISDADAICLFGVSLGDTDQTWVKKIGNKIANGTLTMLFAKDDAAFKTDNSRLVYQRRYKKAFIEKLKNLGLSFDENRLELYVEINSSIFTKDAPNPHEDNLKILHNALSIQKNDVI